MLTTLVFAAAAASHAGIPYDPPTTPIDDGVARVQLSAGMPGEVTKPHVHLTNRVMIYFQAGTNTIRYPDGKIIPNISGRAKCNGTTPWGRTPRRSPPWARWTSRMSN